MINSILSSQERNQIARQWALKLILLGVVLIVVSTLYPFKLSFTDAPSIQTIFRNFRSRSSTLDVLANIILFMPLGFGLASALARRRYNFFTKLLAISLVCGALSFGVEILQIFLPGRKPAPMDVISNGAGGGVGFLCFHYFGSALFTLAIFIAEFFRKRLAKLSLKQLVVSLVIYSLIAGSLVVFWQSASLRGWNTDFPLSIGSNSTFYHRKLKQKIDSSWNGTMADLVFSDRTLSKEEVKTFFSDPSSFWKNNPSVLAAYSLRGEEGTKDLTGQSPDLVQQGESPLSFSQNGVRLSADHWLRTSQPINSINERIRKSSTFTVSALVATDDSSETALSSRPIISIAPQWSRGNLSIAQFQSDLQIILTYSRTTRGQRFYQERVPTVFGDLNPHRILITYSGFVLRVYIDGMERFSITDITPNRFQIMFYLLILFPLGLLITLVVDRLRHRVLIYLVLVGGGTILPAFLLEGFWATVGDRNIRISNLLLCMLIVGGTILASQGNPLRRLKATNPHPSW